MISFVNNPFLIHIFIYFSNNEVGSPHSPLASEDTFNRSIQAALLNLGKTGQEHNSAFGQAGTATMTLSQPAISPHRVTNNQRERYFYVFEYRVLFNDCIFSFSYQIALISYFCYKICGKKFISV